MDEISPNQEVCSICKKIFGNEEVTSIGEKGASKIKEVSNRIGDNIVVEVGSILHKICYRKYTFERNVQNVENGKCTTSKNLKRSTREAKGSFDGQMECLFCGNIIVNKDQTTSYVMTDAFTKTILNLCDKRKDDWSSEVRVRIEYHAFQLFAAD